MNIKEIGFDVDGVLADLFTPWCEYISDTCGIDFTFEKWVSWEEPEHRGCEGWRDFLHLPDLYREYVEPYPEAYTAVHRARTAGYGIAFTTAIAGDTEEHKLEWLKAHGLFLPGDRYCPGSNKNQWGVDVLIDDGFHNVVRADCPAMLVSRPWNSQYIWGWRADDVAHAVDMIVQEDKYAFIW